MSTTTATSSTGDPAAPFVPTDELDGALAIVAPRTAPSTAAPASVPGRRLPRAGGRRGLRGLTIESLPALPDDMISPAHRRLERSKPIAQERREVLPAPAPSDLVALSLPGAAWVFGRLMLALAVAGLAFTAERAFAYGTATRSDWVWSQLAVVGAMVVVGAAGTIAWSACLAANARRLRLRTVRPLPMALAWLVPLAWTAFVSLGLRELDIAAEIDPVPGIAAIGFAIAMAVPYGATSNVLRSLSPRSLRGWWWSLYVVDVFAFGLAWEMLASSLTADQGLVAAAWRIDVATACALFLMATVLVAVAIAAGGPQLVRERIAVLEDRRGVVDHPDWFRTGMDVDAASALPSDGADRALMAMTPWRWAATAVQFAAGLAVIVVGVAGWWSSVTGSIESATVVRVVAVTAGAATVLHLAAHVAWSVLACVNAGRTSVRCAVPAGSLLLAVPLPVTAATAMLVADHHVWSVAVVGMVVSYASALGSIWVLGTAMANLGGALGRFRIWLVASTLTAGAALGTLVTLLPTTSAGPAGIAPALMSSSWALMLMVSAIPANRAMRTFDERVRDVRQAHRRAPELDVSRQRSRRARRRVRRGSGRS